MTTYRERREARADRLDGWAEKRRDRAEQASTTASQMADAIPFGQPILVGHYSERRDRRYRDRIAANMGRAVDDSRTAARHADKAANIRAAADAAVYDDDPDAVERLTVKLARLEAERDRIKRYNASCRKGARDVTILNEHERADLATLARVAAYQIGPHGELPGYQLSNLGATIRTTRQRIEKLARPPAERPARLMAARYPGDCTECDVPIERGDQIRYTRGVGACHAHHTKENTQP